MSFTQLKYSTMSSYLYVVLSKTHEEQCRFQQTQFAIYLYEDLHRLLNITKILNWFLPDPFHIQ